MPSRLRNMKCLCLLLVATLATVEVVSAFHLPFEYRLATYLSSPFSVRDSSNRQGFSGDRLFEQPRQKLPRQQHHPSNKRRQETPPGRSRTWGRRRSSQLWSLGMSFPEEGEPTSRGRAIVVGLSGLISGLTVASASSRAVDPIRKTQELLRIWGQEEADNVLGELASPEGGKTLQPVLALIPILILRLQLDEVETDLRDLRRFPDALAILQAQEFQKKDIKRVFNAYSDNIYFLPDSERENKYLQGGASPSSRQTLQYLLRNDAIDNVEALTAEIAFLIRERETVAAGGDVEEADLDEKDLKMYLAKCKDSFDRYLGMVLQNEIDEATDYAKVALAAKKKLSASRS